MNETSGEQVTRDYRIRLAEVPEYALHVPEFPLGALGDIPVAYAVFQVEPDKDAGWAKTTYYLYANNEYCRLTGFNLKTILGVSHLEVVRTEEPRWRIDCYEAAYAGKVSNGITYSTLLDNWVTYNIGPAAVEGCCVCAFIPIDREQRTRQMTVDAKTSLVISELLGALAGENSFDIAMNDMLVKTAELTNAERVCVFECYGPSSELSFEWCAEGVESQLGVVKGLSSAVLKSWFGGTKDDPVTLVPDSDRLARFSPALYTWCMKSHVKNLMVAPFYNEGEIVGFLGAYNYRLDDSVDIKRVFSEIRSFVGARIENRRLIDSLDWAGKHDALTGLLNRRGFQAAMDEAGVKQVDAPVVIALMDLDDFKHTNDTYGHACGDEALCEMARFLERVFPEDAILCRTGGDEFMVCLLGEDAERIEEIVAGFRAQKVEYMFEGVKRSMTASIGYSLHAGKDFSMREAFAQADEALYEDKRNKRLR